MIDNYDKGTPYSSYNFYPSSPSKHYRVIKIVTQFCPILL